MGGRGYNRNNRGGQSGGQNQQRDGGRNSSTANFNPFASHGTAAPNQKHYSNDSRQSYSAGSHRHNANDNRQSYGQQQSSNRSNYQNQQRQQHGERREFQQQNKAQSSLSSPGIFGFGNDPFSTLGSVPQQKHFQQQQQQQQHRPNYGNNNTNQQPRQPFGQKQNYGSNNNSYDMETDSAPVANIFGSGMSNSGSIFGQPAVSSAPQGIFNGVAPSTISSSFSVQPAAGVTFGPQSTGGFPQSTGNASSLFGQQPKQSSSLASFKQKQQEQLAQLAQSTPSQLPVQTCSAASISSSGNNNTPTNNSKFHVDLKSVYSKEHFIEYGVPTLAPNDTIVY